MTNSDMQNVFIEVFNQMLSYLNIDHKFMCKVPESTLSSCAPYNIIVGMSGEYEGNLMFGYTKKTALQISSKLMGAKNLNEIDFYTKSALADFFTDFSKRLVNVANMSNIFLSPATYIAGSDLKSMISKVPSVNLFFKVNGEKFDVAYHVEKV